MGNYLIRFAATLNPHGDGTFPWPCYMTSKPKLLTFNDGTTPLDITMDTYCAPRMAFLRDEADSRILSTLTDS